MATGLSIVIPFYNEAESLPSLYEQITDVLKEAETDYEIIMVNDGSSDGGGDVAAELAQKDSRITLINQQGNFGKSEALDAAFNLAEGDLVITMDADLQDDPGEIPKFIAKLNEGYDLVSGWKFERKDPLIRRWASKIFNATLVLLTGIKLHDFNCGFKGYRRDVVKNLSLYGDLHRFIPVLAQWKGFSLAEIKVNHNPRKFGRSKYGITRYIRGFFDLFTVLFITHYMRRPLHFFGVIGLVLFLLGGGISVYFIVLWLAGNPVHLRPMMLFGLVALILGIQFISLGLLGELLVSAASKLNITPTQSIISARKQKSCPPTDLSI